MNRSIPVETSVLRAPFTGTGPEGRQRVAGGEAQRNHRFASRPTSGPGRGARSTRRQSSRPVLGTLAAQSTAADFVQSTATQSAGDLLLTLNKHLRETLTPRCLELQLAADTEWPWRNPANANQRKAFGLPADSPAGG